MKNKLVTFIERYSYQILFCMFIFLTLLNLIPPEYYDSREGGVPSVSDNYFIRFFGYFQLIIFMSAVILPLSVERNRVREVVHQVLFGIGFIWYSSVFVLHIIYGLNWHAWQIICLDIFALFVMLYLIFKLKLLIQFFVRKP